MLPEAISFIDSILKNQEPSSSKDEVISLLEGNPLAIQLGASFLKLTQKSWADF